MSFAVVYAVLDVHEPAGHDCAARDPLADANNVRAAAGVSGSVPVP